MDVSNVAVRLIEMSLSQTVFMDNKVERLKIYGCGKLFSVSFIQLMYHKIQGLLYRTSVHVPLELK